MVNAGGAFGAGTPYGNGSETMIYSKYDNIQSLRVAKFKGYIAKKGNEL